MREDLTSYIQTTQEQPNDIDFRRDSSVENTSCQINSGINIYPHHRNMHGFLSPTLFLNNTFSIRQKKKYLHKIQNREIYSVSRPLREQNVHSLKNKQF